MALHLGLIDHILRGFLPMWVVSPLHGLVLILVMKSVTELKARPETEG